MLAFGGSGLVASVIKLATFSSISHVGFVVERGNRLYLVESTTLAAGDEPCVWTGRTESGVRVSTLASALKRQGKIFHYPLRVPLTEIESRVLRAYANSQLGKRYDLVGALKAGGIFLRLFASLTFGDTREQLFCSELCVEAYRKLGRCFLHDSGFYAPGAFLRRARLLSTLSSPHRVK